MIVNEILYPDSLHTNKLYKYSSTSVDEGGKGRNW